MTTPPASTPREVTRRRLIRDAAILSIGAAALGGAASAATTKMAQKTVSYQDKPKGAQRCDNCLQWEAPNGCKVVAGVIAPSGWCSIYSRKA